MSDLKISERIDSETGYLIEEFQDENGECYEIVTGNNGEEWTAEEFFKMKARYI